MRSIKSKLYESHNVVYEYDEKARSLYIPIINCTLYDINVDSHFDDSLLSYLFDTEFPNLYNTIKDLKNNLVTFKEMGIYKTELNQIDEEVLKEDSTYVSEVDW